MGQSVKVSWFSLAGPEVVARDEVPERPDRQQPRAAKRRPKPFPLLNEAREQPRETTLRNRYWKNNPRKSHA